LLQTHTQRMQTTTTSTIITAPATPIPMISVIESGAVAVVVSGSVVVLLVVLAAVDDVGTFEGLIRRVVVAGCCVVVLGTKISMDDPPDPSDISAIVLLVAVILMLLVLVLMLSITVEVGVIETDSLLLIGAMVVDITDDIETMDVLLIEPTERVLVFSFIIEPVVL